MGEWSGVVWASISERLRSILVSVRQPEMVRQASIAVFSATLGFVLIAPLPGATSTVSRDSEKDLTVQREDAQLASPLRQCGKTRHAKDISIVSYQYVNCAIAQEVAARRAAGQPSADRTWGGSALAV